MATACTHKPAPFSKQLIIPYQTDTIPSKAKINITWIRVQNKTYFSIRGDTVGKVTYDNRGRVLEDRSNPYWDNIWKYDSSGIITDLHERDWDVSTNYKITYSEAPDSLLVYQKFVDSRGGYTYSEVYQVYRFDEQNRLIERTLMRENDLWNWSIQEEIRDAKGLPKDISDRYLTQKYFYDDSGKISRIELWTDVGELTRKSNQLFYYTGTRLDSTVRTFDHYCYNVVSYFDSDGLERKRVYADTLVLSFTHVLDKTYLGPKYFRSE